MPPLIPNHWTTDPEYIDLLNFLIERTENVESPMPIKLLVREFKENSGAALTTNCLQHRIGRVRQIIHGFEHIDTNTKVKLIFALSASVDGYFLEELKKNALVEVDEKNRITHYKANNGRLELTGDHSLSAKTKTGKLESKRSFRSLILSYFEGKNDADAIPTNEEEGEMWKLIEFISEKCENVNTPLSTTRLTEDFVKKFRASMPLDTVRTRIRLYGREIQRMEFFDTRSKVLQLFGISAAVNSDCLEKFRKSALVEVDEKDRIVLYKANDGSLELRGDHSLSAKTKSAHLESKRSHQKLIRDYFENKNNADAVPKNEEESEMWNLIGFITEKCVNADTPLNIFQLAKDFNNHFGLSRSLGCMQKRIKRYCHEIQEAEFLDTPSKVKQLFGLGVTLDSDCLEKLRKDAVVKVDNLNRITKYTANNGRLTLHGDHSRSAKRKLAWIEWKKKNNAGKKHRKLGGDGIEESEKEDGYSDDDSDEYSSEEFDSEFDSNDEIDPLNETEDLVKPSNEANDFDNETPARDCSATEMSIDNDFDFDPPTERSHVSEGIEMGEDQENDPEIIGNTSVKTRYGRLSKRRHLDSAFSNNQMNSHSSGTPASTNPTSPKPAKQKMVAIEKEQASNSSSQSKRSSRSTKRSSRNSSFSAFSTESAENMENQNATTTGDNPSAYHQPHIQGMEVYDYNPREDNIPESHSIDNRLGEPELPSVDKQNTNIEAQNTHNRSDAVSSKPNSAVRWTIDPEYIDLLNYIIERTENVESPLCIKRLAREFKENSGAAPTAKCLQHRIERIGTITHSFEHIDAKEKVKLLFALSAPVDAGFLEELQKNAFVEVDDKQRITHYKANDGHLELRGDHSRSAKMKTVRRESKQGYRSLIIKYFVTQDDAEAAPKNKKEKEMWNLIEFITEKCGNINSPLRIKKLAEDFVEKFHPSMSPESVRSRIERYGLEIQGMDIIDTRSKVQQLFGLSAAVNSDRLEELRKNALVEVDEKDRIVYYKANDRSLELRGDHSLSAKTKSAHLESKRSHQKLIRDYFERKNDVDTVPENVEEKEMWSLIDFITEKCDNVKSPLSICRVAKEFHEFFGIPVHTEAIPKRIKSYCREIQKAEFVDTQTSVKQLFGLSATVNSDYLEKLRKDAHVEVDKKNRISYYKTKNGSLELRGDHSLSAKQKTGNLESKRSFRLLMNSYFEKKNDADAVPKNREEKEMWNLIEFITEKCVPVDTPLSICQLANDFNKHFEIARSSHCIQKRIRKYCHEIQIVEFLDTPSKVKQLFGLSATLDSNFLKELRKVAIVEVDNLNRITKYTANNGRLTLQGDHSRSAKRKLAWIECKKKNTVKTHCSSDGDESEQSETENGYSEEDSDQYSSEEFGSDFDSDDENDPLDKTEEITESSNGAVDNDNCSPIRNRSPTELSIDDNFDFVPPTERGEDQENDQGIMGNTSVTTRYGRLSKKRNFDAEFSYNLASSRSTGASMNTDSASSKPAKQKKMNIENEQASISSNQSRWSSRSIRRSSRNFSFSTFSTESKENIEKQDVPDANGNPSDYPGPSIQEMEDYDYNPIEDNIPDSSPIDNQLEQPEPSAAKDHNTNIEAQNTHNRADVVVPELHPEKESLAFLNETNSTPPTNGKEVIPQEVPVNVENGATIVEDHPEDAKPVTAHNPKIKFFEAMQSLILFLDTPSLSNLQSKIHQKIQKMRGSKEVLQNNELIPALEILVAQMANHSVIDISEGVMSVSLIQFLCYLKASLLNSKLSGVEGLMNNIGGHIEKSQNKKIPMKKVMNALRATLDIDDF